LKVDILTALYPFDNFDGLLGTKHRMSAYICFEPKHSARQERAGSEALFKSRREGSVRLNKALKN
jgi:hypothetical protein